MSFPFYNPKEFKLKIKKNVLESPLYDAQLFTKNLETAYEKIFKNYINNDKHENPVSQFEKLHEHIEFHKQLNKVKTLSTLEKWFS